MFNITKRTIILLFNYYFLNWFLGLNPKYIYKEKFSQISISNLLLHSSKRDLSRIPKVLHLVPNFHKIPGPPLPTQQIPNNIKIVSKQSSLNIM